MTGLSWRAIAIALGVSMLAVGCGADPPPPLTAPPVAQAAAWPNLAWVDGGVPGEGDPADGESIAAVAAGVNGFVAIGVDLRAGGSRGTVRWSADGSSWERVDQAGQFEDIHLVDVAAGPSGYVAVGTTTGDDRSPHPALVVVFESPDGRTWLRRRDGLGDPRGYASAVAGGPDGYLVTADASDDGVSAWSSRDGQTWRPIDPAAFPAGQPISPVAEPRRGGWMALGPNVADPSIMHAPDGLAWTATAVDDASSRRAYEVTISRWGYLIIGAQGDCGPFSSCAEAPVAWWSAHGLAWGRLPSEGSPLEAGGIAVGVSDAHGFVVVRGDAMSGSPDGWAWTALGPGPGFQPTDVVVVDDRVVAVGEAYRPDGSMFGRIAMAVPAP